MPDTEERRWLGVCRTASPSSGDGRWPSPMNAGACGQPWRGDGVEIVFVVIGELEVGGTAGR